MRYYLILGLIFGIVLPQVRSVLSLYSDYYTPIVGNNLDNMNMGFVKGSAFYFVLGYYLSKLEVKRMHWVVVAGLFGFLATIILSAVFSQAQGKAYGGFYGNILKHIPVLRKYVA